MMIERDAAIDDRQMLVSTFFLGDAAFGLDTAQVQEVVRVVDITPVHHAPSFVLGVMNLRGRISTVIDLGVKLDLDRTEIRADSRIFIVDWQGEQIGLLVDRVADAIAVDRAELKPAPENVRGIQGRQFKGVFQEDDRLVALLDMASIMSIEDRAETTRSE
jgi:purine-binding chemotaxis protein CheW